jgi:hypothetical protein
MIQVKHLLVALLKPFQKTKSIFSTLLYLALSSTIFVIIFTASTQQQQEHDDDGTTSYSSTTHHNAEIAVVVPAQQQQQDKATRNVTHTSSSASSNSPLMASHHEYLLRVPFYVYEEEILRNTSLLNFTEMYRCQSYSWNEKYGVNGTVNKELTFEDYVDIKQNHRDSGDIFFIKSALEHPMRTHNPEEAKLFVVPSLITYHLEEKMYKSAAQKEKADAELRKLDGFLGNLQWFQRHQGREHVAPISYFMNSVVLIRESITNIAKCNLIQFYATEKDTVHHGEYLHQRIMYPMIYNGVPCRNFEQETKKTDITFIGALHRFTGHGLNKLFKFRRDGCDWIRKYSNVTMNVCGYGDKCPHLSQALLGLHFRGDTLSANRLFDTILSGTVPVFTMHELYASVPNWYDWEKISYFANVQNQTEFLRDLNEIVQNKSNILLKVNSVMENRELFDWQTLVPFDVYMVSACCMSISCTISSTHSSNTARNAGNASIKFRPHFIQKQK